MIKSTNPTTGEILKTFDSFSEKGIEKIINSVDKGWHYWRSTSFSYRSQLMQSLSSLLRSRKEDLAHLMALEMGKVKQEGIAEIEKCAWVCDYYAQNAEIFLSNESIETEARNSFVTYQPLGTILAVMPWNFPFWQVFRFAAPTIMAGNTAVLKHASNVPQCAIAIAPGRKRGQFNRKYSCRKECCSNSRAGTQKVCIGIGRQRSVPYFTRCRP
jgi:succinate-semialdehyde dehydrogenase/glutarate-semialdehyde dehydrogenase